MFKISLPFPDASVLLTPPLAGWPEPLRWLLLAGLILLPLLLLVTLYRYELRLVPRLTALVLLLLRMAVLLLILALVCLQPILARAHTRDLPGKVVVAVDRSLSMEISDPQHPIYEKLLLAQSLGMVPSSISKDLFAYWLAEHRQRRDPQMALPGENLGSLEERQKLLQQRQQLHDELIASLDSLTRLQLVEKLLTSQGLGVLDRLAQKHTIDLIGFHREVFDLKPDALAAPLGESIQEAAGFTDLTAPLHRALERNAPDQGKTVAVLLLTDGQHNGSTSPSAKARELGELGVPIYPVAIGARQPPADAAILSIRGPEYTVFKDVEAILDVKFRITGLSAQEFILELSREGQPTKPLARRSIAHDGQDRLYSESFAIKMDQPGTQAIVANLRPAQPGIKELREDNNRRTITVSVADDRAKVLLVDGEARWEYHYLVTALGRDRLVDLKSLVFSQPRLDERLSEQQREQMGLPQQNWPEGEHELGKYACIILGDVDPENLPLVRRQELEKYVADSAGTLILLAGKRSMPLAYPELTEAGESDPLQRLLPIEAARKFTPNQGLSLTLTSAADQSRFMELDPNRSDNDLLWAGHPRPWGWAIVGKAKPGATPLACWLDPRDSSRALSERQRSNTVLARHHYGFGRVLFLGIDSTWRWRYRIGDLYHHRFWGQVIRWAAADRPLVVGNSFVRFGTPQPVYRPGEPVEVIVRLNESLGPLRPNLPAGARILRLEPGKEPERSVALVPLEPRPGQPRVLQSQLRDLLPGRYAVELAIPELADKLLTPGGEGQQPSPLRATFSILPPESKEMVDLELNAPLLEDLAAGSGGKVFTPMDIQELEKLLLTRGIPLTEHHEQKLWQWWGFLLAVVLLLTLEWAIRKLVGLP